VTSIAPLVGGRSRPADRAGWLEKTLGGITRSIEQAIFTERNARLPGWLQRRDPRAKTAGFLVAILSASLATSWLGLAVVYAGSLAAARASRVGLWFFAKRVWPGVPLFTGLVVLPSIFFVPGDRVFDLGLGPLHVAPSWNGVEAAALFVARVGVCVSLAVLLVLTTPWSDVLKALRAFRTPQVFVLILSMTYRYLFLFLHTANGILLARKSRVVGRARGSEERRWISATMGNLMGRAFKMSNDVYAAMLARGFGGDVVLLDTFEMRASDWLALVAALAVCAAAVALPRLAA
jgi:cobalt/nickel transport system permease protein